MNINLYALLSASTIGKTIRQNSIAKQHISITILAMQKNSFHSTADTPIEERPQQCSETGIVNEETLDTIRELQSPESPNLLGKLVTMYLDISSGMVDEITDAFARGDADKVGRTAHSLKSSSAHLGVEAFSESCRLIEIAARENNLSSVAIQISHLKSDYRQAASYLSRYAS